MQTAIKNKITCFTLLHEAGLIDFPVQQAKDISKMKHLLPHLLQD